MHVDGFWAKLGALLKYVLDLLQQVLFGYGRSLGPPLTWALAFIAFGSFVFDDRKEMVRFKDESTQDYSGFWYSLELFLPIVDLGMAKGWRPIDSSKKRLLYARIHQLAGWILIPVAVGVLTGSLK